jgi:murein DD-endopeptidase MepM/ murein hydrolase activator NlpD
MRRTFMIILLFFGMFSQMNAQDTGDISVEVKDRSFRLPLELAVSLSGNYGELRSGHFHTGLDFRVGGVSGAPVYSVMDGYISRISVSPVGYGHVIYINHPNGKTTVYGHLMSFSPAITKWVEDKQYEKRSFQVNLYPDHSLFPVKKGEMIGRAGNTGSSGGPHLHFEIRETHTEIPLNPDKEGGYNIPDKMAPVIKKVNIYSISNVGSLPYSSLAGSYVSNPTNNLTVRDTFYVAVLADDRMNGTNARLAVAKYSYYLDNKLIFSFSPENIPFDKGKYINSVIEFGEKEKNGASMVKSYVEPGNGLINNITCEDNGLFVLKDDQVHSLKIEVSDYNGNTSFWNFKVVKGSNPASYSYPTPGDNERIMPWYLPNIYEKPGVKIFLLPGSLYRTILFVADTLNREGNIVWRINDPSVPLHNQAKLSISTQIPERLREKAFIARVNEKGGYSYSGGEWKDGWVEANISSFGNYTILFDTISPVIVPNFAKGENVSRKTNLKFSLKDDMSGISSYEVLIDGNWALPDYDPKSRSVTVKLDPSRIRKGARHDLQISAKDNRNNVRTLKSSFIW